MALFRTLSAPEPLPPINGDGVVLRGPQMADYSAWAELREASRKFLTPWEPTWPSDDLTRPAFRQRLRRYAEDMRTDQAYPFFLFRAEDNVLVGAHTRLTAVRPRWPLIGPLGELALALEGGLAAADEQAQRDRQVEAASVLLQVGGSEVDDDAVD